MRSRLLLLMLLLVSSFVVGVPHLVHAAIPFWGPIIPPGVSTVGNSQTCPLGWGGVLLVVNNIISLAITILIAFIAPLMFAYAGFLYVVNPVNPSGRSQANTMMLHTVVGIVIALAGYLIVATVMSVLYSSSTVGTPWYSLITSGGQDPCMKVASVFSQSAGATSAGLTANSNDNNCPGNLICSTDGGCQQDPQLDATANGALGNPCIQSSTTNTCAAGLVCDNTDACDTVATNPDPIPISCAGATQQTTCTSPATCQSGYCAQPSAPACSGTGQSTCTAGTTCQNSVCVSADGNGNAIACTSSASTGSGIAAQICSAAQGYYGTPTSGGPGGGTVACAWSVNNILTNAGVANLDGTNVASLESAIENGRGTLVPQSQGVCGDIVVEADDGHVGICMNNGCTGTQGVLSNSSSKAQFVWYSDITFAPSYSDGPGRVYQLNN